MSVFSPVFENVFDTTVFIDFCKNKFSNNINMLFMIMLNVKILRIVCTKERNLF